MVSIVFNIVITSVVLWCHFVVPRSALLCNITSIAFLPFLRPVVTLLQLGFTSSTLLCNRIALYAPCFRSCADSLRATRRRGGQDGWSAHPAARHLLGRWHNETVRNSSGRHMDCGKVTVGNVPEGERIDGIKRPKRSTSVIATSTESLKKR